MTTQCPRLPPRLLGRASQPPGFCEVWEPYDLSLGVCSEHVQLKCDVSAEIDWLCRDRVGECRKYEDQGDESLTDEVRRGVINLEVLPKRLFQLSLDRTFG